MIQFNVFDVIAMGLRLAGYFVHDQSSGVILMQVQYFVTVVARWLGFAIHIGLG